MGAKIANKTSFKKGIIPWNKGLKRIHLSPKSEFKKGQISEEKHPSWKGDNIGRGGVHAWIKKHYGWPNYCEMCNKKDEEKLLYDWANISGKYRRERNDWKRLCRKCHRVFDEKIHYEKNKKPQLNNKSGYRGIVWDISRNKWMVSVYINKKQTNVGRFIHMADAIIARNYALQKIIE